VERRNSYRILVENPEGKKAPGRPRSRWVDNIKMNHRKVGWGDMEWIDLAEGTEQWRALVNMAMSLRVP
jgi:hypothetical protein